MKEEELNESVEELRRRRRKSRAPSEPVEDDIGDNMEDDEGKEKKRPRKKKKEVKEYDSFSSQSGNDDINLSTRQWMFMLPLLVTTFLKKFFEHTFEGLSIQPPIAQTAPPNLPKPDKTGASTAPSKARPLIQKLGDVFKDIGVRWKEAMTFAKDRVKWKWNDTSKKTKKIPKAETASGGQCLEAVRTTMEHASIPLTRAPSAKDKILGTGKFKSMIEDGWVELKVDDPDTYPNKVIGDVVVEDATPLSKYGHIQYWNGKNWVSDFVQNSTHVHTLQGKKHYYRYNKLCKALEGRITEVTDDLIPFTRNGKIVVQNENFGAVSYEGINVSTGESANIETNNEMELIAVPLQATTLT